MEAAPCTAPCSAPDGHRVLPHCRTPPLTGAAKAGGVDAVTAHLKETVRPTNFFLPSYVALWVGELRVRVRVRDLKSLVFNSRLKIEVGLRIRTRQSPGAPSSLARKGLATQSRPWLGTSIRNTRSHGTHLTQP